MALMVVSAGAELPVPSVPAGAQIALDGKIEAGEWDGAFAQPLAGGGELRVLERDGRVWLAIVPRAAHATYVDLFLQDAEGRVHNLHASLQWGERVVTGTAWDDREPPTRWGKPATWSANRIEWAPGGRERPEATKASFRPYDAHEFSISRDAFPGKEWRVRIEVRDFGGKQPDVVIPAGSDRREPAGWAVWRLK